MNRFETSRWILNCLKQRTFKRYDINQNDAADKISAETAESVQHQKTFHCCPYIKIVGVFLTLVVSNEYLLAQNTGYVYWTASTNTPLIGFPPRTSSGLQRANLDGTNQQTILADAGGRIALTNSNIYYKNSGMIRRANLDGSQAQDLINSVNSCFGIALTEQHIYYHTWSPNKISRADLDGTNVQVLVSGGDYGHSISLDTANGHMYWTTRPSFPNKGAVYRADMDGGNQQVFATTPGFGFDIELQVLDPSSVSQEIRYVPFKSEYVLMALMALLGGWLVLWRR